MGSTTPTRERPRSTPSIRVLLVEMDDPEVDAARDVLEGEFGIDVIATSAREADRRSLESVDCVVVRLRDPAADELAHLRTVREVDPRLPYIVVSETRTDDRVDEALTANATDFLRTDPTAAGYRVLAPRVASAVAARRGDERRRYPSAAVADGSCLLDDSLTFVTVGASYADLHGYGSEELVGESVSTVVPEREAKRLEAVADGLERRDGATEGSISVRRDGRSFASIVSVTRTAADRYVCTVFDRTARGAAGEGADLERRVRRLERLVASLDDAETDRAQRVCDAIVETLANGDGSAAVAVYLHDEAGDALRRRAATSRLADATPDLSIDVESTPAWRAAVAHEPVLVADLLPGPTDAVGEPERARGIVVPIGTHGVLLAGTLEGDRPTTLDHALARLAGATAGRVLDRLTLERRLERRENRLASAAERAERLAAANDLVRDVGRAIDAAVTRPDLESRVCERIVADDRYAFARIADYGPGDQSIDERARAGTEAGSLETETGVDALVEDGEPTALAMRDREPRAVRRLLADSSGERWRRDAITRGYRSVLAVPLVFRERSYGGLAVYSERPDAFDGPERESVALLGEWVGHAIRALEARRSLVGRGGVELEFRVRDSRIQFLEWARETGSAVEFETVVSRPDGSLRCFVTVEDADLESVLEIADRSTAVTGTRLVSERGTRRLFECTPTADSVVTQLLEYGAVPTTISASDSGGRLVVTLPDRADVRRFVDAFERLSPDSTLVRRRDLEHVAGTAYGFLADLEAELTDRQFEALEAAFVAGYFDVPREATGTEVAASLGVAQPTFNRHLRVAQRKLLSILFAEREARTG